MPVAPPVPVVPEGPTEVDPVLPDVPPDGAPDMPAPLPDVESGVLPAVPAAVPPMVPLLPDVLLVSPPVDPVAPALAPAPPDVVPAAVPPLMPDPPDIAPVEPVLPVDGEAVVLGVVVVVVDAPGEVVSSVRRSQPATTALNAAVASMSRVSLDIDCIKISLCIRIGFLSCDLPGQVRAFPTPTNMVELHGWNAAFSNALQSIQRTFRANMAKLPFPREDRPGVLIENNVVVNRRKSYMQNEQALHSCPLSLLRLASFRQLPAGFPAHRAVVQGRHWRAVSNRKAFAGNVVRRAVQRSVPACGG